MCRVFLSTAFLLAGLLYLHLRPFLAVHGISRSIHPLGNTDCITIPELQACEKVVLHPPSGLLYLACSTPSSRLRWMPALHRLDVAGVTGDDYVAVYDPRTHAVHRLAFTAFSSPGGISLHGMDVVVPAHDPSLLYVYLVNHRLPASPVADAARTGADSVIELFETRPGHRELRHITTFADPAVIVTPNDVVGSPDGKSVYFTNDNARRTGHWRRLWNLLVQPWDTSVGLCHVDHGCRFAYRGLHAANGIVKGLGPSNDTFFVADCMLGQISVLRKQPDHSLALAEVIHTGMAADNLAVDANGALWIAALADLHGLVSRKFKDPSAHVASTVLRVTTSRALGGQRYDVDRVFEDPGQLASGITSATYDPQRGRLFMHGVVSTHLTVCQA